MIARLMAWLWPRVSLVLVALLIGVSAYAGLQTVRFHQKTTELAEFRRATADISLAREQEYTRNLLSARQREQSLVALAEQAREEKHVAVQTLDRRVAALLDSLRNARAARPASIPRSPAAPLAGPAASGTGAGLYRDDAQFLVGLAASAARVALERDECRAQYRAAEQALNPEPQP